MPQAGAISAPRSPGLETARTSPHCAIPATCRRHEDGWWGVGRCSASQPRCPTQLLRASSVLLPSRDLEAPEAPSPYDIPGPAVRSSMCGIDHEALHKQIVEYKRRKEKGHGGESESLVCLGLEPAAELRRQMKRWKKARPRMDEELSPKNYPWELAGGGDLEDGRTLPEELTPACEWEHGEAEPEVKAERGEGRRTKATVGDHDGHGL